ncbi:MAG TPA: ATP-binding protein, partial [Bryobacteraceae bacterium]|nr:ATP-binding protein [Bryobacteraceae bacterium]
VGSGSDHNVAFCDRHGTLWFGLEGLSRFDPPRGDRPAAEPPPIRITKVRVSGADYPVSELGETELSGLVLQPEQNELQIEFASFNFAVGDVIRYQYKLEGVETDWSAPGELRTVNYPHLTPGRYRLLVRAVNSEGLVSAAPAVVSFRLLPPVWRRWWFLGLAVLLSSALVYAMYRYRLERLLDLERVRTRIANDLHDDIGSTLTQIAIMSEVTRQQAANTRETDACPLEPSQGLGEPLARIAELSRMLVDSMSDVVWAINPRRDHLSDLAFRMRRFASEALSAREIELAFSSPSQLAAASLGADVRREVFRIFKESVHNIVRHSKCQRVEITLKIEGSRLLLNVSDDGTGLDLIGAGYVAQVPGHGLDSMKQRTQSLGGTLRVASRPGGGTCVVMEIPLDHSRFLGRKKSLPK